MGKGKEEKKPHADGKRGEEGSAHASPASFEFGLVVDYRDT